MKKKYLKKRKLFLVLFMFVCVLFPLKSVVASEEGLTYTIAVEPVENQINKKATYYDLLVKPETKQTLSVIVSNTGDQEKSIRVTPTNAITNQNGVIDYSRQTKEYKNDDTLKYPFTSLVGPEQVVKVKPNESMKVNFELTIPKEPFSGEILGCFVADLPDEKAEKNEDSGVKIVNKFQLVKAVMLRESEEDIKPELKLNDVKASLVNYRTAVTANLQNIEPTMFGKMTVEAKVTKKGQSAVIKKQTTEELEMAPNSNFDFPIMWDNKQLEPGDYTLNLVATSGENGWKFTKDFTITAKESEKLNKEAVDIEESSTPSYWLYILIGLLILAIIILIIVLWIKHKNAKKIAEEKRRRKKAKQKKVASAHKKTTAKKKKVEK